MQNRSVDQHKPAERTLAEDLCRRALSYTGDKGSRALSRYVILDAFGTRINRADADFPTRQVTVDTL